MIIYTNMNAIHLLGFVLMTVFLTNNFKLVLFIQVPLYIVFSSYFVYELQKSVQFQLDPDQEPNVNIFEIFQFKATKCLICLIVFYVERERELYLFF